MQSFKTNNSGQWSARRLRSFLIACLSFLFIILVAGGCGGGSSGTGIEVNGKLLIKENGQPLAGIPVRIKGTDITAVTNADGTFTFEGAPRTGSFEVVATIEGQDVSGLASDVPVDQDDVFILVEFSQENKDLTITVKKDSDDKKSSDPKRDGKRKSPTPTATPGVDPRPTVTPKKGRPGKVKPGMPQATPTPRIGTAPQPTESPTPDSTSTPKPTISETPMPTSTVGPIPTVTVTPEPTPTAIPTETPTPGPSLAPLPTPQIDGVSLVTNQGTFTFTGTKANDHTLHVSGLTGGATVTTGTMWSAGIPLIEGENEISFWLTATDGRSSPIVRRTVIRDSIAPQLQSVNLVPLAESGFTLELGYSESAGISLRIGPAGDEYTVDKDFQLNRMVSIGGGISDPTFSKTDRWMPFYSAGAKRFFSRSYDINPGSGRTKIELTLNDGSPRNESHYTFFFDSHLLQPHPLGVSQLLVANPTSQAITSVNAESDTFQSLTLKSEVPDVRSMVTDPHSRMLYWLDGAEKMIFASELSGSSKISVTPVGSDPTGLTLDPYTRTLYWVENSGAVTLKKIAMVQSATATTVGTFSNVTRIDDMVIDPIQRALYWSDSTNGKIGASDLGLSSSRTLFIEAGALPFRLAFDMVNFGTLYFTDRANQQIRKLLIRTGTVQLVRSISEGEPLGIAFDNSTNQIYWSTTTGSIERLSLDDQVLEIVASLSSGVESLALSKAVIRYSGRLTDGGNPVANAEVYINASNYMQMKTRTDANGRYEFTNLPFGAAYQVGLATRIGYIPHDGVLTGDGTYDLDVATYERDHQ